jgi:hypothetical protein
MSNCTSISGGVLVDFNSKDYSKLMSLLSLSSDVVVLRDDTSYSEIALAIDSHDPTLYSSFWDELIRLYFTEVHLIHPLFSLKNFSLGKEYWIRTNIIYYTAYKLSSIKSPMVDIKMKKLLNISECYLNRSSPSLLNLQCCILLYLIYRATGDLNKKRVYFYNAIKISHLIGLTNKRKGLSFKYDYERYLCYTKLIELYWGNRQYSTNMGLSLDPIDMWPKFGLNWQLIDSTQSGEIDIAIANNISLNVRFIYLVQIYVTSPFINYIEIRKTDTNTITQLELKLDEIYSEINKSLRTESYCRSIPNYIKMYYLMVKQQLNSAVLNEYSSSQFQANYIKLNFDIITEYSKPNSLIAGYSIVIHLALQSVIRFKHLISEEYSDELSNLISVMTNIVHYSENYKIADNIQ